jgi:hypothetical protein
MLLSHRGFYFHVREIIDLIFSFIFARSLAGATAATEVWAVRGVLGAMVSKFYLF